MTELHAADIIVFLGYVAALLAIGLWAGRKTSGEAAGFFLTSKSLPWYAIGPAIIAAGISSEQFLGTVGFAYDNGLAVANWEWLNGPAILILTFIFVPFYIRRKVVTMPQFLEMRFDGRVRSLFAVITLLTYIFINLAGVIYSGGFALNVIFGIDLYAAMWGMTVLGGLFVIYGGMESVAWTNVFQAVLLLGSGLLVFFLGLFEVPGGWDEIIGEGTRGHLVLPADHPVLPGTGLLVLALSTNVWFFCSNQMINQAVLGAKNEWHARLGVLLAGFLGILIAFADTFPGMIAFALNPNLATADSAYPYVVGRLVPIGLRGIVFAGLTGAILSTIEALGNASSTIFTMDIYKRHLRPAAEDKELIRVGRIVSAVVLIVGALWAPTVMSFGHIFSYFQEGWAFIAIPIAVIFVLGGLWRRVTTTAALWTLLLSFPMLVLPYLLRALEVKMNVFNVAGFVLIFTLLFTVVLSLVTREKHPEGKEKFIWRPSMARLTWDPRIGELPWYRKLSFWTMVLVSMYVFIYATLW